MNTIEYAKDNIIKEMEKKISQYEEERVSLLNKIDRKDAEIKTSNEVLKIAEDWRDKLKCCGNCKHGYYIRCELYGRYTNSICNKWEMRE